MEEGKQEIKDFFLFAYIAIIIIGAIFYISAKVSGQGFTEPTPEPEIFYDLHLIEFEKDSPNEYLLYELYHAPSSSNSVVPLRSVHHAIQRIMNRENF